MAPVPLQSAPLLVLAVVGVIALVLLGISVRELWLAYTGTGPAGRHRSAHCPTSPVGF